MHPRQVARLAGSLLAGLLALSACAGGHQQSPPAPATSDAKTVTIALIAPLSGSLSSLGVGMSNAAKLAIDEANKRDKIPGWTIKLDPEDDQSDPNTGAAAATRLSFESSVGGVIGTVQSSVAAQVAPILSAAKVVEISPVNTNPSLTQGASYLTHKERPYPSYFRLSTTDSVQAAFGASYARQTLGARRAYVVNDGLSYGQGLTQDFATEFTKEGGAVLGSDSINETQPELKILAARINATDPDIVYFGGQYLEGAMLAKQLAKSGGTADFMGGDGLLDKGFISTLGKKTAPDYVTNVGAEVQDLPRGRQFVAAYKAAGFNASYGDDGPMTYDATNVLIDALAKVLPGKAIIDDATRQATIAAVQATHATGVSGPISFDKYGDATTKRLTMYKVVQGDFVQQFTGTFAG